MRKSLVCIGIAAIICASGGPADAAGSSHAEYVKEYKGTASCTAATCHEGAAREVTESLHYQQRAVPMHLEGWQAGKLAGMTESY